MSDEYKISFKLSIEECKRLSAMVGVFNLSFEQIMMMGVRQLEELENLGESMDRRE